MKKTFTLAVATLMLAACSGNQQQGNGNATESQAENATESTSDATYKFVEPQENIAEIFWNSLKTNDKDVKKVIDEAVSFDYISQEEAIKWGKSKTFMQYEYVVPRGSEEPDNYLGAKYQIQCYQKLDKQWIGIVVEDVWGYGLAENGDEYEDGFGSFNRKRVFIIDKDGKELDTKQYFPAEVQTIEDHFYLRIYTEDAPVVFSPEKFTTGSRDMWDMDYVWDGKSFTRSAQTPFLTNNIDNWGRLEYLEYRTMTLGDTTSLKEIKDGNETIATFNVENGKLMGYEIKSPKCGFAQTDDYDDYGYYHITSKPIAIGQPISNVLDYKKSYDMKDSAITISEANGRYTITQQLRTDVANKIDIFIEFAAKDKNSAIESLRVYANKKTITLASEVEKSKEVSSTTKKLFSSLAHPDPENLTGSSMYENGAIGYYDGDIHTYFWVYDYDNGHKLALEVITKHGKITNTYATIFDGTNSKPIDLKIEIPKASDYPAWNYSYYMFDGEGDHTINADDYSFSIDYDSKLQFNTSSDRNNGEATPGMKDDAGQFIDYRHYRTTYFWNGKEFVKEESEGFNG